jgi:asparagine N-glycosylation enzyme membrane subunit Stt3
MASLAPLLDRPVVRVALLVGLLAAGAGVRLTTWPWVFGHDEVRFASDGDALYHVLQAERLERDGLAAVWRDPYLGYPTGAEVPWPPLFDGLLWLAGRVAAGGHAPDRATLAAAAMWVPPVAGLLTILLLAWLARALLGGRPWLDAALALALLPAHAVVTSLGRPDHHALEPLLLGLLLLGGALAAADRPGRAPEALLGGAAALAFWNWNGSALYLALLAGFAGIWHLLAPAGDGRPGRAAARLALGLGGGAALLAGSVALLAPPGALWRGTLSGLTGLQPALVAGAALGCALLALARRARPVDGPAARLATLAAALLVPPALLLLLPTGDGMSHGLDMLSAASWYRTIAEFRPLLPSGFRTVAQDLDDLLAGHGLTILAVPCALPLLWRRFRAAAPAERGPLLLAGVTLAATLALGWARSRFACYLSLAEALAAALLARAALAWAGRRWPAHRFAAPLGWLPAPLAGAAAFALLLAPALPGLPSASYAFPHLVRYTDLAPLGRLAGRIPRLDGREAILSAWSDGHDFRYWSGRPVVSSPFGVEGGPGALEADAAFHFAADQGEAEAILARRRVGLVALTRPIDEVISLLDLAPPGRAPVAALVSEGLGHQRVIIDPTFNDLVAMRLWLWDGMSGGLDGRLVEDGRPALDAFRLVGESSTPSLWQAVSTPLYKLFQPVAGLRLTVRTTPGARVEARVALTTAGGRREGWRTSALAGADGRALLRLPYATGQNGEVQAGAWLLSDGQAEAELPVLERDVLGGATAALRLR